MQSITSHSVVLERQLLHAILNKPQYIFDDINSVLNNNPEHFFVQAHQRIYREAVYLRNKGKAIDPVLITERLKATNSYDYDTIDSLKKLNFGQVAKNAQNASNLKEAANLVLTYSLRRKIGNKAISVANSVTLDDVDCEQVIEDFQNEIEAFKLAFVPTETINIRNDVLDTMHDIESHMNDNLQGIEKGIKFGYPSYDNIANALKGNMFCCMAGRPGTGKTAFAVSASINIAKLGTPVLYFSLEMDKKQLYKRMLSYLSCVDSSKINKGILTEEQYGTIRDAGVELQNIPLYIDDTPDMDMFTLRNKLYSYIHKHGVKIVFIDYLQLINPPKAYSREREVAEISRTLKKYSKEFDIPIVILAQLNREAAAGKPEVHHLRESGAIEQDADIVVLLYEDPMKAKHLDATPISVIIGKNRHGTTGETTLLFKKQYVGYYPYTESTEALPAPVRPDEDYYQFIDDDDSPF